MSPDPTRIHLVQFIMKPDSTLLNLPHTNTISLHTLGATGRQDTYVVAQTHGHTQPFAHLQVQREVSCCLILKPSDQMTKG